MHFDFSPVAVVADAPRAYRIPALGVELAVVSMTESNAPFYSEILAKSAQESAMGGATDEVLSPESVAAQCQRDAPIIARHGLRGWSGVRTSEGAVVDFSVDAATAWLRALAKHAPHEFKQLRAFLKDPSNFTRGSIDAAARAYAGNSPGV